MLSIMNKINMDFISINARYKDIPILTEKMLKPRPPGRKCQCGQMKSLDIFCPTVRHCNRYVVFVRL